MLDNEKDFKLMIICYAEEAHNINMQGNTKIQTRTQAINGVYIEHQGRSVRAQSLCELSGATTWKNE